MQRSRRTEPGTRSNAFICRSAHVSASCRTVMPCRAQPAHTSCTVRHVPRVQRSRADGGAGPAAASAHAATSASCIGLHRFADW
jgi:hypothetical protein